MCVCVRVCVYVCLCVCLLYISDAADEEYIVRRCGGAVIKKK